MTKPFYQLALMTIDNPDIKGETFEHDVFIHQFRDILRLLHKAKTDKCKNLRAQYRFQLGNDFECFLKILVTAENAFWYQYLLKTKLPELYNRLLEKSQKCKAIYLDKEFTPRLLYNELEAANLKNPETSLSRLIFDVYSTMCWGSMSLARVMVHKQSSLKNLKLINDIEKCSDSGDLKMLEKKLGENLLLITKSK